jgi:catechol 2,3-dioxygenase-like lactoylglutathione lyase family enzyme
MTMQLTSTGIDLGIIVRDGPAALAFYRDLLGMRHDGDNPVPSGGTMHRLFAGESMVKIVVPDPPPPATAAPGSTTTPPQTPNPPAQKAYPHATS